MINKTDNITIGLDRFGQAKYLSDCVFHELRKGNKKISVNVKESFTGSNVCAPIAGIINYYRKNGVKIWVSCPPDSYASHVRLYNPIPAEEIISEISPFNKVFSFSSEEGVFKLVNTYLIALRQADELEKGVIQSLEWCMNETIDNVLQHSMTDVGFVMAQLNRTNKTFNFCVFDSGIGIYNSLRNTKHAPEDALSAIKLSMKERITRDASIGQGNGLWGLSQIIKETNGRLNISSGGARFVYDHGLIKENYMGSFNFGANNGTTMIDFLIDYSSPIDIVGALNGYEPIDVWAENHENDLGEIELDVAKEASGTGTRKSAERLRNIVRNFLKSQYSSVILDFRDVSMLSSSFADELIGKLIADMGFSKFLQCITITNLNEYNSLIVNRSVGQRMAQIFMDEKVDETLDD